MNIAQSRPWARVASLLLAPVAAAVIWASPADAAVKEAGSTDKVIVERGDTLSGIASKYEVPLVKILADNPSKINDPDVIYPGQRLTVTQGYQPKSAPQTTAAPATPRPAPAPAPETVKSAPEPSPEPKPVKPAPKPSPAPNPDPAPEPAAANYSGIWDRLAQCESNGNWNINTGNGFYGGLQFTPSSWQAVGGSGLPNQASKQEQINRAEQLQAIQGWGAWPACSAKIGLL